MNLQRPLRAAPLSRIFRICVVATSIAALAGCSLFSPLFGATVEKPKPTELPANVAVLGVRQAWTFKLPTVGLGLQVNVSGDTVTVASQDGTVVAIDARNGQESWRASAGAPLTAGVGSDGAMAAVVTRDNELVALQGGKVLWKQRLPAEAFTAPLVAGRRIFVQTADRTTSA